MQSEPRSSISVEREKEMNWTRIDGDGWLVPIHIRPILHISFDSLSKCYVYSSSLDVCWTCGLDAGRCVWFSPLCSCCCNWSYSSLLNSNVNSRWIVPSKWWVNFKWIQSSVGLMTTTTLWIFECCTIDYSTRTLKLGIAVCCVVIKLATNETMFSFLSYWFSLKIFLWKRLGWGREGGRGRGGGWFAGGRPVESRDLLT